MVTYYGIRESLLSAANGLEKQGHKVINFSLMYHQREFPDTYKEIMIEFIKSENIEVILWWYINIPTIDFEYIVKETNIKNIFFNWDEPSGWICRDLGGKAKFMECAFVCCNETKVNYTNNGAKKAVFLLPGYDPEINYIMKDSDKEYDCDISIVCTELYGDEEMEDGKYSNQYINRKKLIDIIYENQRSLNYTFKIYGPEYIKNLYPDSYGGFVRYENLNKVFNSSKINICTHAFQQYHQYVNERAILIMGSGGLIFLDRVKGFEELFVGGQDCVYIDKDNILDQIKDILYNYEKYCDIRLNARETSKKYTWDKWGECIHKEYLSLL